MSQSVSTRAEVARYDHNFAGCLVDGLIEIVPSLLAAEFQMKVGEPNQALDIVRHAEFHNSQIQSEYFIGSVADAT
jgi:hypothetical protein